MSVLFLTNNLHSYLIWIAKLLYFQLHLSFCVMKEERFLDNYLASRMWNGCFSASISLISFIFLSQCLTNGSMAEGCFYSTCILPFHSKYFALMLMHITKTRFKCLNISMFFLQKSVSCSPHTSVPKSMYGGLYFCHFCQIAAQWL